MNKLAPLDKLLERARQDQEVLAVFLYGSAARQEQGKDSDVDICLVLTSNQNLSKKIFLSRKRLAYLKEFSFDIQIFQQLPLYIRNRVLKEAKVLFVRDEDLLYELAIRTIKSFEDFKHIYYSYLEEVKSAG
jgi:predicted nucleotidyltransferase